MAKRYRHPAPAWQERVFKRERDPVPVRARPGGRHWDPERPPPRADFRDLQTLAAFFNRRP